MKIGRNDPCPCESGKKYKKCCLPLEVDNDNDKGGFEFSAGSYGNIGEFFPSIACKKRSGEYHFILIKQDSVIEYEDDATEIAEKDLNAAFSVKAKGGTDQSLAEELKNKGYIKVEDFNIVKQ